MATFSERRSKHGSKWQAKIRLLGHPTYSHTLPTREEAVAWAAAKEASLAAGQSQDRSYGDAVTVKQALASYNRTMEGKLAPVMDALAQSSMWELPISEISPEDVLEYSPEPNEATLALRSAIEYVRRTAPNGITRNPVKDAYAKATQTRERRVPVSEEHILLDESMNTRGGYLHDAIVVALDTALMQKEIIKLDWSNVDLDKKVIRVNGNAGVREIAISDRLLEVLKNRGIKSSGLIFDGVSSMALQRAFIRTVERAKIADLHFNDLRYEALCRMLAKGLSTQQLWSIIGSKTLHPLARILGTSE